MDDSVRKYFAIESQSLHEAEEVFSSLLLVLQDITTVQGEPMINMFVKYADAKWLILVFPRTKHRPEIYFLPEGERMIVSPAIVDYAVSRFFRAKKIS